MAETDKQLEDLFNGDDDGDKAPANDFSAAEAKSPADPGGNLSQGNSAEELDSFFEDLSAIETPLPKTPLGSPPLAPTKTKPAKVAKPKPTGKGFGTRIGSALSTFWGRLGSLGHFFQNLFGRISWRLATPIMVVVFLGALAGWYFSRQSTGGESWLMKSWTWVHSLTNYVTTNKPSVSQQPAEPTQPKLTVKAKPDQFSPGKWRIQVAACLNDFCKQSAEALLKDNQVSAVNVSMVNDRSSSLFLKLYLTSAYDQWEDAKRDMQKINLNNRFGLQSYLEKNGQVYRIVLGFFPQESYGIDTEVAKVQAELHQILPNSLTEQSFQRKWGEVVRFYVGPFASRADGQKYLDGLQKKKGFEQAFLTNK